MEPIKISDNALTAVSSSAERFIGYIYAGVLPLIILVIENSDVVGSFVSAIGGLLSVIIIIACGIGIYTVYFRVVGELLLFPFQHLFHYLLDAAMLKDKENRTSTIGLLVGYGVPILRAREAYESIKDMYFSRHERTIMHIDHGELHILYITATITMGFYVISAEYMGNSASPHYLWVATVSYFSALIGDTRQHSKESAVIRKQKDEVTKFLSERGLLRYCD